MAVTSATFVIDFGSITDAYLTAELDESLNGKTSFSKGDTVHFKVYSDVNYTIEVTSGTIQGSLPQNGGLPVSELIEDNVVSFVKGDPAGISKLFVSMASTIWHGNDLGAINGISNTSVQATNATEDTLGIATIGYNSRYYQHRLLPPGGMTDTYHILVYIKAVA